MENFNRTEAIQALKAYQKEQNIPQSQLAKMLGISETALSQWLNDAYKGNSEKIDTEVAKFLKLQAEKKQEKIQKLEFAHTSVSETIFKLAKICQLEGEIGACYGVPGVGKTTAVKKYAEEAQGVIIVECEDPMRVKSLTKKLFETLGLGNTFRLTIEDMRKSILNKLKGSGWLVIIDEAEHLHVDSFAMLRRIHDFADESFGLLFVGTHKLYNHLTRLKGDHDYLTSRMGYMVELKKLTKEDVESIAINVTSNQDILEELYVKTDGNARRLTKTLKRALRMSKMLNAPIDSQIIAESQRLLII